MKPELAITRDHQVYEEPLIFERSQPGREAFSLPDDDSDLPLDLSEEFIRESTELPEVSEPDVVRHFTRLSTYNYAIDLNLYPLGSCTMKYNPRINEEIAALPQYSQIHPATPAKWCQQSLKVIYDLQESLKDLTDLPGITLQPAAGAHGELLGLFLIKAYHNAKGQDKKTILVPDSAHGTNPASCTLAGLKVKELKSTPEGTLSIDAVKAALDEDVAGLMVTNPNTLGVFENDIVEISRLLHEKDALIYMDGANYNAIVGRASLGEMGIDVSHMNLHKTFSTPHGGGGPGGGAVVVSDRLKNFLPGPIVDKAADGTYIFINPAESIGRIKAGPGHFGMMIRALTYILSYGNQIHEVAEGAVLNANIIRHALEGHFQRASKRDTMHEVIFSDARQKKSGLDTLSLAKTLIDYGFHPPTVYFPLNVSGSIMIEPTESENLETIEQFCNVMIDIAKRMEQGDTSMKDSPQRTYIGRIDEAGAARNPVLNYFTE